MIKFKFLKNMIIAIMFFALMSSCNNNENSSSKDGATEAINSANTTSIILTTRDEPKDLTDEHFDNSMNFSISSTGVTNCTLIIDYYNGDTKSGAVEIYLNGDCVKEIELPSTGSWDSLGHINEDIVLNDGENKIILNKDKSPAIRIENLTFSSSVENTGGSYNSVINIDGQNGVNINNNFDFQSDK